RRSRWRSMLITGVMPLPALMKSSLSGSAPGSLNVPSTPPSRTIAPGCAWRRDRPPPPAGPDDRARFRLADEERRDDALLDELGRDADAAVRPARIRCQRVRAPVVHAVDHDADAQVLPGLVPRPLPPRLDEDRRGVGGLALDPLDPAAQLLG